MDQQRSCSWTKKIGVIPNGLLAHTSADRNCKIAHGQCYWTSLKEAKSYCTNWKKCEGLYQTGRHNSGRVVWYARSQHHKKHKDTATEGASIGFFKGKCKEKKTLEHWNHGVRAAYCGDRWKEDFARRTITSDIHICKKKCEKNKGCTGVVYGQEKTTTWHLAPVGATKCDRGHVAPKWICEKAGDTLAHNHDNRAARELQVGNGGHCGRGGWGNVPRGCSVQAGKGGDWAAHYKHSGPNCNVNYRLVCSGAQVNMCVQCSTAEWSHTSGKNATTKFPLAHSMGYKLDRKVRKNKPAHAPRRRLAVTDSCYSGQGCYSRRRDNTSYNIGFDTKVDGFFPTECTECLAGRWSPPSGGKTSTGDADKCHPCYGASTRRRRATQCTKCHGGFYKPDHAADSCKVCSGGAVTRRIIHGDDWRALKCQPCEAGKYDSRDKWTDECQTCFGGSTRRRRSRTCSPCPVGTNGSQEMHIGACLAVTCPNMTEGENVNKGCKCLPGLVGQVFGLQVSPFYENTCGHQECPENAVGRNVFEGCKCKPGYRGKINPIRAEYQTSFKTAFRGTCRPVGCPRHSKGDGVPSDIGCQCDPGYAGQITPSYTTPYFSGHCQAVTCPEFTVGLTLPKGCRCAAGYSGSVAPARKSPHYTSTCTPAPCPNNSYGQNVPRGCKCEDGFKGEIKAEFDPPYSSGSCKPAPEPDPEDAAEEEASPDNVTKNVTHKKAPEKKTNESVLVKDFEEAEGEIANATEEVENEFANGTALAKKEAASKMPFIIGGVVVLLLIIVVCAMSKKKPEEPPAEEADPNALPEWAQEGMAPDANDEAGEGGDAGDESRAR